MIKNFIKPIDYIVFGSTGFLGSNIINVLKTQNKNFIISDIRLNNINKMNVIDLFHNEIINNNLNNNCYLDLDSKKLKEKRISKEMVRNF